MAMNPWEACALQYNYSDDRAADSQETAWDSSPRDPVIYPGLYAPSGIDMMSILLRVAMRPNPTIDLGPVDASVALLLCDAEQPDAPIVYSSDAFHLLTGYSADEIAGLNCRFLQAPGGRVRKGSARKHVDKETLRKMRKAVEKGGEVQLEVVNFRKDGTRFTNLLSIVPVVWDGDAHRYFVGFQGGKDA